MVRGLYVKRAPAERMLFDDAMDRYLQEVTPTKRPVTQQGDAFEGFSSPLKQRTDITKIGRSPLLAKRGRI